MDIGHAQEIPSYIENNYIEYTVCVYYSKYNSVLLKVKMHGFRRTISFKG